LRINLNAQVTPSRRAAAILRVKTLPDLGIPTNESPQSLSLIISAQGVKPAGVMKTPSGTFVFVALVGIVIVTVISCHPKQLADNQNFDFDLRIGNPSATPPKYVQLKGGLPNETAFDTALAAIKKNKGTCDIQFLSSATAHPTPKYCDQITPSPSLKTDSVTKSEAATRAHTEEAAANDPHVTYRVQSNNPIEIKNVLDTLATPTATPTP
jgi:hypothetical protein